MNKALDENKLIEGLKLGREIEQAARKMSEMATVIAYKYRHRTAGTYDPEKMKILCEALDVKLPSES